jgi:hypothetical protein
MINAIQQTLGQVEIGAPQSFSDLTMVPLFYAADAPASYLTLDEALGKGLARVTEVSEGGHVPELRFENLGESPVFLMDGEELIGARQNRVINISILVGARKTIAIPVSCVERGRWSYVSREFRSADRTLYASAKAAKMRHVSQSLREERSRRSDQAAVWRDIAEKSARLSVDSTTEAMADMYEGSHRSLDEYHQALRPVPAQAGAAFAIGGRLIGIEVFDAPATFAKLFPKLVAGYALDAIDRHEQGSAEVSLEQVRSLLRRIAAASAEQYAALGEGQDVRLSGYALGGGALVVGDRVIHLAAFEERS